VGGRVQPLHGEVGDKGGAFVEGGGFHGNSGGSGGRQVSAGRG
jgi:hypothetical protein